MGCTGANTKEGRPKAQMEEQKRKEEILKSQEKKNNSLQSQSTKAGNNSVGFNKQEEKDPNDIIKKRTEGVLDREFDEFKDCIITNEQDFQNKIKLFIPTYIGEKERNMKDEILTHTFQANFSNEHIIAINGIHVKKIEIQGNSFCIFHDSIAKSNYYYEAFIIDSREGINDLTYFPSPKPNPLID